MGVSGGPYIVRDSSLVLELDAADRNSYVSGSTTWRDLTATNNNGTLTNGPTFNSGNGGNFVFDGTNDYINCGNQSSIQITSGSISAWVKTTIPGVSYRSIIAKQGAWGLFTQDNILVTYDWGNNTNRSTSINIADGKWKHVAMTFSESTGTPLNNAIIYLNGIAVLTTTIRHSAHNINLQIAEANANQYLNGSIAYAQVYSRVLSSQEIQQNYNALKSRFNL